MQVQAESEGRAWQRQVWGAALSWGAEAPKDLQSRILPDYRKRDGGEVRKAATPYPVHADVAQGLAEAMKGGLLTGPVWTRWPAARDGRPLLHIWEGIALTGGLK